MRVTSGHEHVRARNVSVWVCRFCGPCRHWKSTPHQSACQCLNAWAVGCSTANVQKSRQHCRDWRGFSDTMDIIGQTSKYIEWRTCSVCITTTRIQQSRCVHTQERASSEKKKAQVQYARLRDIRAVTIKKQRHNRNWENSAYQCLGAEMCQKMTSNWMSIRLPRTTWVFSCLSRDAEDDSNIVRFAKAIWQYVAFQCESCNVAIVATANDFCRQEMPL